MMDALRELIDFALEFPEDADVGSKGETNRLGEKADKELAQLQAIATAAREQNDEFNLRCEQAIARLDSIANDWLAIKDVIEYNRIMGKIEGIKLAMSYHQDFVKRHPELAAALAALEQETK